MAATRAVSPSLNEAEPPGVPVLERLQYRTAQPSKGPGTVAARDSALGSTAAYPPVALFPSRGEEFPESEDGQESAHRRLQPEADWQSTVAALEKRLAEEKLDAAQAIAMAREQGRREAAQAVEQQAAAEQQRLQRQVFQALEEFRLERQNYFHHVEAEVVRLALAIATRVLHREAQMDPQLLAGAVRVALDKLGNSSNVVMRVAPREVGQWKDFFRVAGNSRVQPGVLEDPSLASGECVLATELGTIELGVRAQLEEIEQGFFDLLDRRPAGTGAKSTNASRGSS
ncbi:MAG: FliH/SctL family protein [Acidobacteriaceae bacterium]